MDRELPKPVQMIEVFPEKKCYVCGRTEEEFRRDFPVEKISNLIVQRTQELKQLRECILQEQVQFFKDLLADSKGYPQDLTVSDLLRGEEISKKTMPRYTDLIQLFHPKRKEIGERYYRTPKAEGSTTIGEIRRHISEIINQLAAGHIPEEAKDTELFDKCNALTLESDGAKLPFDFVKKDVGFLMDVQGRFLQASWFLSLESTSREPYYRTVEHSNKVPENQVLDVKVYIYLCWTCAKMFKEAS